MLDLIIRRAAKAAEIIIPSNLSPVSLFWYSVPSGKDGLPNYSKFDKESAGARALNALCEWFETLDKENNQDQIEKIAKAISEKVPGHADGHQIFDFFVKVIHHQPTLDRLRKTGVIKYIGERPELVEPLMGIVDGKQVEGAFNLLEFKAAQELFDVDYKKDKEDSTGRAYYNAKSTEDHPGDSVSSRRTTSLTSKGSQENNI